MSGHTNTLVAFLLMEFLIFVVRKGELAKYKGYLFG